MTDRTNKDEPLSRDHPGRRSVVRGLAGGLLAAPVLVAGGQAMAENSAKTKASKAGSAGPGVKVTGTMPMLPDLAKVMPDTPALLDALATEFAPVAAKLATQQSYWVAFNGWITNRLSGPALLGETPVNELGAQTWAVLASAYWGGMELRQNWGMPPAMERLGIKISRPFADLQKTLADAMIERMAALNGGGEKCLQLLQKLLHDDTAMGVIWSIAYNAGCQVVKTEDPPIGQRRPHRKPQPSAVRINTRDFMRVDYDLPSPDYLKIWRSNFEKAVTAHPDTYEKVIVGEPGQLDPRDIWKRGVVFGNKTWGGGANDMWTEAYYDDVLHWSTVVNFGVEAAGQAAFVALINRDAEIARRAVMGNALYIGMASGWLMGMLDVEGKMADVHPRA
ncbi:MAG: hypothetical protein JWR77_611 [Rhizorhabdus sp.]|nr:hypothetical protein [Rhizorhabdus sp.]